VGVYFGTTSGEVWGSGDEGNSWQCLAQHLPEVYGAVISSRPRTNTASVSAAA